MHFERDRLVASIHQQENKLTISAFYRLLVADIFSKGRRSGYISGTGTRRYGREGLGAQFPLTRLKPQFTALPL